MFAEDPQKVRMMGCSRPCCNLVLRVAPSIIIRSAEADRAGIDLISAKLKSDRNKVAATWLLQRALLTELARKM
jgi:hypothetical protein